MLKQKDLFEFITIKLTHLTACIKRLNKRRFFDLNVVAEDTFARLLNEVYGYALVNLNHKGLNQVAIDLGDVKRRLGVQVTSQRDKGKIQKTIDKFEKHGLSQDYTALKVVIIGERTGNYPTLSVPRSVQFAPKDDVIDVDDLLQEIESFDLSRLDRIVTLLKHEIREHPAVVAVERQTDRDALNEYRSKFNRAAFQHNWTDEDNYAAFKKALVDLCELLNDGTIDDVPVAKKRAEFENADWEDQLETIHDKLLALRALFNAHVKSGEIDLESNVCRFNDSRMLDVFNTYKQSVVDEMNRLLSSAGLKPIKGVQPPFSVP
jgi:hypothetical protein